MKSGRPGRHVLDDIWTASSAVILILAIVSRSTAVILVYFITTIIPTALIATLWRVVNVCGWLLSRSICAARLSRARKHLEHHGPGIRGSMSTLKGNRNSFSHALRVQTLSQLRVLSARWSWLARNGSRILLAIPDARKLTDHVLPGSLIDHTVGLDLQVVLDRHDCTEIKSRDRV